MIDRRQFLAGGAGALRVADFSTRSRASIAVSNGQHSNPQRKGDFSHQPEV